MRKYLVLSIIINIVCLPLATIYIVRKVQFYKSIASAPVEPKNENLFWKVRNSEFKTLAVDTNSIVFIGDSHTQFFEVAEAFNNIHVKNRGIGLDGTSSVLDRMGYIINKHPKKVFIQIGINDLLSGVEPEIVAGDIDKMISETVKISPRTEILIQSVFPTNWNKYKDQKPVLGDVIELNKKLHALADRHQCTYIDLFSLLIKGNGLNPKYDSGDSLHLNGAGYLLWKKFISDFVNS